MATSEAQVASRKSPKEIRRGKLRAGLFAEWRGYSAGLAGPEELTDDELRIWWANEQLRKLYAKQGGRWARIDGKNVFIKCDDKMISSWKDLNEYELRHLPKVIREETGEAAAYRADLIERIARELAEPGDATGQIRCQTRFGVSDLRKLAPADAHALIEELLSRLARKELAMAGREVRWEAVEARIEELRARFQKQKAETRN